MEELIKQLDEDLFSMEYKVVDGQWILPNSTLINFYRNMRYRHFIFYNISDLDKWNPMPYFRSVRMWIGFKKGGECVGGFWLSTYNQLNKSGFFNCAVTKNVTDKAEIIRLAGIGLRMLLNRDDVKTIYGETSVTNLPVLALADYFGFQKIGIIPNGHYHANENKFCDTVMMYLNKDTFKEGVLHHG